MIDEEYIPQLKNLGVVEIFPPGSSLDEIANLIKEYHGGKEVMK